MVSSNSSREAVVAGTREQEEKQGKAGEGSAGQGGEVADLARTVFLWHWTPVLEEVLLVIMNEGHPCTLLAGTKEHKSHTTQPCGG